MFTVVSQSRSLMAMTQKIQYRCRNVEANYENAEHVEEHRMPSVAGHDWREITPLVDNVNR